MVAFSCDDFTEPFTPEGGGTCSRTGRGEQHFDVQYDCGGGLVDTTDGAVATVTVERGPGGSASAACIAYDLEILTD